MAALEYRIAEEIGASDDAKTWTLKIRDGVEFHNGKTVTAEDVVATLERHSDEKAKSGALGYMKGIESIKASGKEVILTLKEANADLPYLLSDYHLIVQPNGGKDGADAGISAGPYKITVNEPGVRHGGERFANYWQGDKMAHADQVEIIVINDATARTAALQGGQVHMINRVEPKIVDLIKRVPGVTIHNRLGSWPLRLHHALQYGAVRQQRPAHGAETRHRPRGDARQDPARLRLARQRLPDQRDLSAFSDDIEQRKYDPDKAAFHYKKSGHSGPILLRTSDVAFPGAVDATQLFQQSAAKAGITLEIKREPGDGYWAEVWNKQPFSASYWGGRSTQDQMYSTAYCRRRNGTTPASCGRTSTRWCWRRAPSSIRTKRKADVPRHGGDRPGRRRPDPADVQPGHRRDRPEGGRLDRGSAPGTDERLRSVKVLARGLSLIQRPCPRPSSNWWPSA